MATATAERPETESKVKNVITIRLPDEIAEAANASANAADLRLNRWALKIVCDTLGVEMPKASRIRAPKYNTPEEREAARKASVAKRNDKIKHSLALLEQFEKFQRGEITLDEFTTFQANGVAA